MTRRVCNDIRPSLVGSLSYSAWIFVARSTVNGNARARDSGTGKEWISTLFLFNLIVCQGNRPTLFQLISDHEKSCHHFERNLRTHSRKLFHSHNRLRHRCPLHRSYRRPDRHFQRSRDQGGHIIISRRPRTCERRRRIDSRSRQPGWNQESQPR